MSLGEVVDVLARHRGLGLAAITEKLNWLDVGGLEVIAVDGRTGRLAGELHARHSDRAMRAVSMADCLVLASASLLGERLATSDPHLAEVARPPAAGQDGSLGELSGTQHLHARPRVHLSR